MSLRQRVLRTIGRYALLRDGRRVLVGLSGGADSVALLLLLRELERDGVLTIAGAAHLNHRLRGAEADEDEAFCAALAARLEVPFRAERTDVAALARAQKRSIEDAARSAREELRAYLRSRGQAFREDSSNANVTIPRNRIRHELIPYLESHFSPGITDVLARAAALARQDEEFLHAEAIKLAARIVLTDVAVRIDAAGLSRASRALGSRVAQAALQRLAGSKPITFDHVERLLALVEGPGEGGAVSLPGQYAVRVGGTILLCAGRAPARRSLGEGANSFAFSLSIPGEVELALQRLAAGAEPLSGPDEPPRPQRKWPGRRDDVGITAGALELPLAARSLPPASPLPPPAPPSPPTSHYFLLPRTP